MKNKTPEQKKKLSLPLRILMVLIVVITVVLCAAILSDSEEPADGSTAQSTGAEDQATDECVLIDNDTVKATFIGAEDASSLGVFYVTLKIENKTDTEVVINLEDADVDGETIPLITTGVPLTIRPGNSGQTSFIFSMVNLSISAMGDAENATFRIAVRDSETYDVIYKSDLVTVDLY